jgi:WD40 repeat protein
VCSRLLLSGCRGARACGTAHAAPAPPPRSPRRPRTQLTHDGRWLTTADSNTVRVWDAASLAAPVLEWAVAYPLEAASYCPARGRVVAGGEDMWVHLHDAATGAELDVNKGHHGPVHTVRCGRPLCARGAASQGWACVCVCVGGGVS